jgi:DNA-binding NarL/FixJ family response regulator
MVTTIGLIDKNVIMRLGIGMIITENLDASITEADNLSAFLTLHGTREPDVLLVGNYGTPKECLATIRQLRDVFPNTQLVVYDDNEKSDLTQLYLKMGVDGHLKKTNLSDEILLCMREVLSEKKYVSPDLMQNLLSSLHGKVKPPAITSPLTVRETQIANLLCTGMRTKNIAHTLERKPSTISTIKNTIFQKMRVKNIVELSQVLGYHQQINLSH